MGAATSTVPKALRVCKYALKQGHGATTRIRSSPRTNILMLAAQGGTVCLWAETLPNEAWEWEVKCVATGEDVPVEDDGTQWRHIGSAVAPSGAFAWHFYMRAGASA